MIVSVRQAHVRRSPIISEGVQSRPSHIKVDLGHVLGRYPSRFNVERLPSTLKRFRREEIDRAPHSRRIDRDLLRDNFIGIVVANSLLVFFNNKTVAMPLETLEPGHVVYSSGQDDQIKLHA